MEGELRQQVLDGSSLESSEGVLNQTARRPTIIGRFDNLTYQANPLAK